ncbi:hypothetical protein CVD28_05265 [Bacillus sp. M6-12]|uniref:Na-translocating system protein MpsC family protein n=1 Tax=Bacillus sp. M6-12 TaxID=2054166 RepID=UPI000C76B574|nr:Na-translocating system protein MpsC family protein [Bacillus sp. M6-12]PLS18550.1 hypothetical protein CVD28_05265 [Bacillus sp. M6-12]
MVLKNRNSIELGIINFVSSFMKEKVGRGPKDVKVVMIDNVLTVFIRGLLSPLEKNLVQSEEGEKTVYEGRRLYLKLSNTERIKGFEKIVGKKVIEHYEGINIKFDTAVATIVFDQPIL